MTEFVDKFLIPKVTGTIIGFLLTWTLEAIRLNYKRKKILLTLYKTTESSTKIRVCIIRHSPNSHNENTLSRCHIPLLHLKQLLYLKTESR